MTTNPPGTMPVVAIVGRPNVGKSALFNRLAGRRLAIVHKEDGVTRDRLAADALWEDRPIRLVDTGGIGTLDGSQDADSIVGGTRRQAEAAMAEATVLIHVVDVQAGLASLDIEVAQILRRTGCPVLVAANKADNETMASGDAEFAALGREVIPVSALHNRGIGELMARAAEFFPPVGAEPEPEPAEALPLRVAILGRPNAGKSSFINALLGEERVIVSAVPGTTRDSIEVPFSIGQGPDARSYLLCDTAGLRPKRKVHEAVEHFSHIRVADAVRRCDIAVLLFDATLGPSRQDKRIASLIQDHRKACVLMVNKWDMAAGQKESVYAAAVRSEMPFLDYAPLRFVSARTGFRIRSSVSAIDRAAAAYAAKITTGVLNRALHEAFEKTRPPAVRGRALRFFYATQVGTRPPRFRLFVNDPERVVDAYHAYLVRRLRQAFVFEGAPVILQFAPRASG